jgi:hypothetical protein
LNPEDKKGQGHESEAREKNDDSTTVEQNAETVKGTLVYTIDDLVNYRPGDPDPGIPFEYDDEPLPPLPAPPLPQCTFDRDNLVLNITLPPFRPPKTEDPPDPSKPPEPPPDCHFALDLTSIVAKDSVMRWIGDRKPCQAWLSQPDVGESHFAHLLQDEIEAAAWEVFWNRRYRRALLFGDDVRDFDLFETLAAGATLDWELGAIIPTAANRQRRGAVPIFDIQADDSDLYIDAELLLERYLCRGGSWLLTGPTGIGKSSLIMQLVISWGLGEQEFGIKPARPLATLVIQAENDDGDVQEQRDGICEGFNLSEEQETVVNEMVSVATVDDVTGRDFFPRLKRLIRDWQPDLVVLDPLLSYVGGDLNKQEVAAGFLRHQLNPILHKANVAAILIHHTGKPPKDQRFKDSNADYAGLGSSELSNWARAISNLTIEGDKYCLTLGKRGKRAGIQDQFGVTRVWLRHAANRIFWEQTDAAEVSSANRDKTADDLLTLVPAAPGRILQDSLIQKAPSIGIGLNNARTFVKELIDAAKVYVHKEKRPRTQPFKYIARYPQPEPDLISK